MRCNCIQEIDAKLKEQNVRLADSNFAMQWPECTTRFLIATQWVDSSKAPKGKVKRCPPLFAAYCPICGKKAGRKKVVKAILPSALREQLGKGEG